MSQSRDARTTPSPQADHSGGMNQGMRVLSNLVAGIGFYALVGWLGDHLLGTRFLLPLGTVLGAAFAMYLVIRRFSADEAAAAGAQPRKHDVDETKGTM